VGGVEYLGKLADSVPSSANVAYYSGIIKDKQLQRELIATATDILTTLMTPRESLRNSTRPNSEYYYRQTPRRAINIKTAVLTYRLIEKRDRHVTGLATGFSLGR
jgi:replicative DNA helicase